MKAERLAALLRTAVIEAKRRAADPALVAADAYCVPVEAAGVRPSEASAALALVEADAGLMDGVRKIRDHGPGKWVVEPYPAAQGGT